MSEGLCQVRDNRRWQPAHVKDVCWVTAADGAGCGSCGRGLVTFAPGRLRDLRPAAVRPVCDDVAGLGQGTADNARRERVPGSAFWS